MTIDTWVALATLVTLFTGFYGLSRRDSMRLREEMHRGFAAQRTEVRDEVGRLDRKIERLGERVGRLGERVGRLDERVARLDERMGRLEHTVGRLGERVERLDDRVYGLAVRLQPALDAPPGD